MNNNFDAYDLYDFYLEVKDLKEKAHAVQVERVEVGEFYNQRERKSEKKIILRFVNRKKCMILNKTQAGAMVDITGTSKVSGWIGAQVVLMAGRATNGRETIVVTTAAESGDPNLMYPESVNAKFLRMIVQLGMDQQEGEKILSDCEMSYEVACMKLVEVYGAKV